MQVEGIPDGWEPVAIRKAEPSDPILDDNGKVAFWVGKATSRRVFLILKKIEKQKRYRPFANAAEFEPHRDKWLKQKSGNGDHRIKTYSYNDRKHYTGDDGSTWKEMFDDFEFEDGTPFGVEVIDD